MTEEMHKFHGDSSINNYDNDDNDDDDDDDDQEQEQDDNEIIDENKCSENDIELLFTRSYHLANEEAISLKKCFILHMSNTKNFEKLAVATSTASVHIFDNGLNNKITSFDLKNKDYNAADDDGNLASGGVRFANNDQNMLMIASSKCILQYDLRVKNNEPVQVFRDTSDTPKHRIITSFDINQNDRILSVGTEQISSESFILFFDVRKPELLGGYWDGHSEDITQIVFHKTKSDWLASGSVDGLINCYDISKENENDAFQYCLNTNSSVQQLNWHTGINNKTAKKNIDIISCITHTNDFHLYDIEESELIVCHDRSAITKDIRRISAMDCNVINCHNMNNNNNDMFLLAGSNFNRGGDCLRSLKIDGKSLIPLTDFKGNKQIIRTSLYDEQNDVLITGGECGIISIWKPGNIDMENPTIPTPSSLKIKSKLNKSKHNPY